MERYITVIVSTQDICNPYRFSISGDGLVDEDEFIHEVNKIIDKLEELRDQIVHDICPKCNGTGKDKNLYVTETRFDEDGKIVGCDKHFGACDYCGGTGRCHGTG